MRGRGWIYGGTLERTTFLNRDDVPSKPSTVGRALRKLAEDGVIQKKYKKGYVIYRCLSRTVWK